MPHYRQPVSHNHKPRSKSSCRGPSRTLTRFYTLPDPLPPRHKTHSASGQLPKTWTGHGLLTGGEVKNMTASFVSPLLLLSPNITLDHSVILEKRLGRHVWPFLQLLWNEGSRNSLETGLTSHVSKPSENSLCDNRFPQKTHTKLDILKKRHYQISWCQKNTYQWKVLYRISLGFN